MFDTRRHPEERDRSGIPDRSAKRMDPNYVQAAVETVAYRHFRQCTPEYKSWLEEGANGHGNTVFRALANISTMVLDPARLRDAQRLADDLREGFVAWLGNAAESATHWPEAQKLWAEVREEMGL